MAVQTSNFPIVRTVTQLVRNLLADEPIAPGFPFQPVSVVALGGIVTATFATPPGYIPGDTILAANFTPSDFNGSFVLSASSGTQITWQNNSATNGAATGGTVQGYGTGKKYTDPMLMAYVNSAYRALQRALKATGSTEFKEGQAFVTIPGLTFADPSAQVFLNFEGLSIDSDADPAPEFDISTPIGQLPNDLLSPIELWERRTGSSDDFIPMIDLTNTGGLPSRPQGIVLSCFEWIGDALTFIGATQDNDIKIRYNKGLPPVSDGASQLFVLNSEDYHAFSVASMATKSRGGRNTQEWDAAAEDAKEKLVNAVTRGQQFQSRRSRAFSTRRGFTRRYY